MMSRIFVMMLKVSDMVNTCQIEDDFYQG